MSKKISQLTELTTVLNSDLFAVVNEGETKKVTKANLFQDVNDAIDDLNTLLSNKSDIGHIHDDRYYTETEIDGFLSGLGGLEIGGSITGATPGSILFAGTGGILTQDNSNLFWDNTNKRQGIGTNSPIARLDIRNLSGEVGVAVRAIVSQSNMTEWQDSTGNPLSVVDEMANLGIGTGNPSSNITWGLLGHLIEVSAVGLAGSAGAVFHAGSQGQESAFGLSSIGGFYMDVAGDSTPSNNCIVFRTEDSASQYTPTERMRITSDGKVSIGNISATALLDINSDTLRLRVARTLASSGASGNQGDICWDNDYLYVCTATNAWKRAALATW